MAIGQKEAVVQAVLAQLPNFKKGVDNALTLLSNADLEIVKGVLFNQILSGAVEYSKPLTNVPEVRSYARSMVMNHLKKAKELNGGVQPSGVGAGGQSQNTVNKTFKAQKERLAPKGVNPDLLPENLKEYAKSLVNN